MADPPHPGHLRDAHLVAGHRRTTGPLVHPNGTRGRGGTADRPPTAVGDDGCERVTAAIAGRRCGASLLVGTATELGLPLAAVTVEITETTALSDDERVHGQIESLHDAGVGSHLTTSERVTPHWSTCVPCQSTP